jgi:hypothetical protein
LVQSILTEELSMNQVYDISPCHTSITK